MSAIITLWLLSGLFGWNILYQTLKGDSINKFGHNFWKTGTIPKPMVEYVFPAIFAIGGLLSLVIIVILLLLSGFTVLFYYKSEK